MEYSNKIKPNLENETQIEISTEILLMLALLIISITLGHYLKKMAISKYLQEAGLTTLIGMLSGFILRMIGAADLMK